MSNLALLMVTQSFSSPCCEDTLQSWAGTSRRPFALVSYKEKTGKRQELGEAPAVSLAEPPQRNAHSDHLTVPFTEVQHWVANLSQPSLVTQERANTHTSLL